MFVTSKNQIAAFHSSSFDSYVRVRGGVTDAGFAISRGNFEMGESEFGWFRRTSPDALDSYLLGCQNEGFFYPPVDDVHRASLPWEYDPVRILVSGIIVSVQN
eukprot:CAMPEP_0196578874 /NCGR_PEP_ID=MMETSP1081-20130531/11600_1 /TAXON_ID=36882 /ORGANISM="Pyramimonas amylifera, Strain CCMP720" /LENGTH=102 /DNA_ID=CAMNT_0041898251 /DNA_START=87 /DNA_END=393 /DNA_ORIENTATION=-